jgi:hypothetical protein
MDDTVGIISGKSDTEAFECDAPAFPECLDFIKCGGLELNYLSKDLIDTFGSLGDSREIKYISPLFVDGSTTTLKEYDKVRIRFRGIFRISILFDNDRLVHRRTIVSLVDLDYDYAMIGIPNNDNKAYSIRFIVEGRGVIYGIQYSWKPRELP